MVAYFFWATLYTGCVGNLLRASVSKRGGLRTARDGLGRLAAWHLPGGPVGPPARWAATSNVERGSETEEGDLS